MCQNKSYRQELEAGILWAPLLSKAGARVAHWDALERVSTGDLVFHYFRQRVVAISDVTVSAIRARRPANLPSGPWELEGRLVRSRYRIAEDPVALLEIPRAWRESAGAFRHDGFAKEGYLFEVTPTFAQDFTTDFGHRFQPFTPLLPAEAMDDADTLLRRLIGHDLRTPDGRPNRILSIGYEEVLVATERSPNGQPVPIEMIRNALGILRETGAVTIDVATLGHRSAFVGAVLWTLPGAQIDGSPPILTMTKLPNLREPEDPGNQPFDGDLDPSGVARFRGEQAELRRRLFGTAQSAACSLCGEEFPVRFLVAAHIKKRAVCTDAEKVDFSNVAMSVCSFGCDALYERGFLTVSPEGIIVATSRDTTEVVAGRLAVLAGCGCAAHTELSERYFAWHRENSFLA